MTVLAARLFDKNDGGWLPPLGDSIPRIQPWLRTAHEYGLSAAQQGLNFRFRQGLRAQLQPVKLLAGMPAGGTIKPSNSG